MDYVLPLLISTAGEHVGLSGMETSMIGWLITTSAQRDSSPVKNLMNVGTLGAVLLYRLRNKLPRLALGSTKTSAVDIDDNWSNNHALFEYIVDHPKIFGTEYMIRADQECKFPSGAKLTMGQTIPFHDHLVGISGFVKTEEKEETEYLPKNDKTKKRSRMRKITTIHVYENQQGYTATRYLKHILKWRKLKKQREEKIRIGTYTRQYVIDSDGNIALFDCSVTIARVRKDSTERRRIFMGSFFHPQKEWLMKHVVLVYDRREKLKALGLNAGCNLLLEGPPGAGKSSFIYRMVMCLNAECDIIDLSKIRNVRDFPVYSNGLHFIIFEEIDVGLREILNPTPPDPKNEKAALAFQFRVTIADLLIYVQGMFPNEHMFMFATTNHYDALESLCPALFRAGRFKPIRFDYLGRNEMNELTQWFFGMKGDDLPDVGETPTSEIMDLVNEAVLEEDDKVKQFEYFKGRLEEVADEYLKKKKTSVSLAQSEK